jgi:hypothetical protein
MPTIDQATLDRWRTLAIVDRAGGTVGDIIEFYLDRGTGQPTWALVNTALFGARETFVPLLHATEISDGLKVPYEKDHIRDAPRVDALDELTPDEEATLLAHYGIEYRPAGEPAPEDPGLAEPGATPADADAEATAAPAAEPPPARDASATAATAGTASTAGEPPRAPGEPGWAPGEAGGFEQPLEPVGHDADLRRRDDEAAADDVPRDDATTAGHEPSMLDRAKRRLEGLVSGSGAATPAEGDHEASDADRARGGHPGADRDRR